jgi:DNA-binding MarR family transcriptional regulator
MAMEVLQELRSTLEELDYNPADLRASHLMDEVLWDTLNLLGQSEATGLEHWASVTGGLAKHLLSRAEPGPATWRVWYAGQLQAVAGLVRSLLGRRLALSTSAMLRQANKRPILAALKGSDLRISTLARQLSLDDSQVIREIHDLVRHQLVETTKVGRERWVRITLQGQRALAELEASIREEEVAQPVARASNQIGEEELPQVYSGPATFADILLVARSTSLLVEELTN